MKKALFCTLLAAIALVSCEHSPIDPEGNENKLPISISPSALTRVTDSSYDTNDEVGLYVVNHNGQNAGSLTSSGNHANNVKFTFSGTAWTPETELFWKDNTTKADFYAYHPYTQEVANVNALSFSVAADQSGLADYKASDFMWGKAAAVAPTVSPVAITTHHVMSNLLIYIENGDGYTEDEFAAADISVKISNVKCNASIDLSTGMATATGTTSNVIPYKEADHYRALLVPQTINASAAFVIITVNGTDYSYKQAITLTGNTRHKLTITIEKDKLNSSAAFNVGPWSEDTTEYSGTITINNELAGLNNIDYIDEYGVNYGKGIIIGDIIWAPVNCGYHVTDYKYGKLYQWGRKYGQGYDGSIYNGGLTSIGSYADASTITAKSGGISIATGSDINNANNFYKGDDDVNYDWVSPQNDQLWNSGTEDAPVKTEYDPCPEGWRVPTYAELVDLRKNRSSWTTDDGRYGFWFSGPATYDSAVPQIFLAAAGNISDEARENYRGCYGNYWSSRPTSSSAYYLYFDSSSFVMYNTSRSYGHSVRCVQE